MYLLRSRQMLWERQGGKEGSHDSTLGGRKVRSPPSPRDPNGPEAKKSRAGTGPTLGAMNQYGSEGPGPKVETKKVKHENHMRKEHAKRMTNGRTPSAWKQRKWPPYKGRQKSRRNQRRSRTPR